MANHSGNVGVAVTSFFETNLQSFPISGTNQGIPAFPRSGTVRASFALALLLSLLILFTPTEGAAYRANADHTVVQEFDSIPSWVIDSLQSQLKIFYGHTSHGSQIMTGLDMVYAEDASYEVPTFHEISDDLGHTGDLSWVAPTRAWLDANPDYNMVVWSWCGGCSDNTEEGINIYLDAMATLEADYADVIFIYMTGHLDGGGPAGNLYLRNNQIRAYCDANNKFLFDFADIESWDPDGNYYPDESDGCSWCTTWCSTHTCPTCGSCAHSHCFNCYQKGKAFWWLLARTYGWMEPVTVDESDASPAPGFRLIANRPNPFNPHTTVSFMLDKPARTTLEVFSATGRRVITLLDGFLPGGEHGAEWNGNDDDGKPAASGVYFYRLSAGGQTATRQMVLVR